MSDPWRNYVYYYGCHRQSGHYLFAPGMEAEPRNEYARRLTYLDGKLAPEGKQTEFVAQAWRLTGYTPEPYSAFSWWDRSVDSRPGSNSIIFVPGVIVTIGSMYMLAREHFPKVMARLPQILFLPTFKTKTREVPPSPPST